MSLFEELKRRNVFRVGIAYLVLGWVLLQVVDVVVPILALPDWVARLVLLLLALGFPLVLVFAWAFELTPEGIKREKDVDRTQSITPQTGRKLDRAIIAFLAVAVILLLADRFAGDRLRPSDAGDSTTAGSAESDSAGDRYVAEVTTNEFSVAVLPFVNMSEEAGNEYFSDGISEELLNALVRVDGLRVPSRTSSFSFKGSNRKLDEIGRELKVDHVLEGSVRKAGNRIRVTAQLIDVNTDSHLWSETYTRELKDIFAVQDEIATAIVNALKITLDQENRQAIATHSTRDVQAYNQFLLGRYLWNQRTTESILAAVKPFRNAVELDPGFDQAWAALAENYVLIPEYWGGTVAEYIPKARQAAERALQINPGSARALGVGAYIKASFDYDFEGANADFERALELEPEYATAHQWYGEMLSVQRRMDEALEQFRIAADLDPLAVIIPAATGEALFGAGRVEESVPYFELAKSLSPSTTFVYGDLQWAHALLGNYPEARAAAMEMHRLEGSDPAVDQALIDALENPELKGKAIEAIRQSELRDAVWGKAMYFAALGEYELALESLERGFESTDPWAVRMGSMVIFDPLRENPRYQALLARMNLTP